MIEIAAILFQIFFIIVLNFFPTFKSTNNKNILFVNPKSICSLTIILLIFSFLSLDLKLVKYFLWILFIINFSYIIIQKKYLVFLNLKFIIFFLIIFSFSVKLGVDLKLGWDAQNFWIIKSLNFFQNGNIYNLQNLPRPDYPHLGSYLWAVYSSMSILQHEYFGRIFFIFLFYSSVYLISETIKSSDMIKSIFFLIFVLIANNPFLFQGYQEVLVFSYGIFLTIFILNLKNNPYENYSFIYIFIISIILSWIKNEAFIFSIISLFSLLIFYPNKKTLISILIVFCILSRLILFKIFQLDINFQSGNYENLSVDNIQSFLTIDRILLIFKYFIFGTLKNPLIIFIFLPLFYFLRIKKSILEKIFIFSFIANIFFIFAAYLFTFVPLKFHLVTSVDRLIFEILGFNLIIFVLFLNRYNKKLLKIFS